MWTADQWRDYELLDASRGERLERWGSHVLVRPDPQAIWKTERTLPAWKNPEGRYTRSSSGGGAWDKDALPQSWEIGYGALQESGLESHLHFELCRDGDPVNPTDYFAW